MNKLHLGSPLELPCGAVLPNRFAKAAMSEHLAEWDNAPGEHLQNLYRRWSAGGTGLLISGNVMIDSASMESRRNVSLEASAQLEPLRRWAAAGRESGSHFWLQLNHPGRQTPRSINRRPVAPSAGGSVNLFRAIRMFNPPRALRADEIELIIHRFASAASLARDAGFTGVQLHAAHGYLISQFLSPLTNQRDDEWGGSLENRSRFLLRTIEAVREAVGPSFPVGIKMNSADFQRGGFTLDDSLEVVKMLDSTSLDLIEVSGGSYESQAMFQLADEQTSTEQREFYFLEYATKMRELTKVPLMVTGGFRSVSAMTGALSDDACDIIGLARPLAAEPDLPARILSGETTAARVISHRFGVGKGFDYLSEGGWSIYQLARMGRGLSPATEAHLLTTTVKNVGFIAADAMRLGFDRMRAIPSASRP